MAVVFPSILNGCIGGGDVKEYEIKKPKDSIKEKQSWSGKNKINSYKMLSVIDDREVFIGSPLYLQEEQFFF
jgi:hypothetical protein